MIYAEAPFRRRPRKLTAEVEKTGEVCLDGGNLCQMAFRPSWSARQSRVIGGLPKGMKFPWRCNVDTIAMDLKVSWDQCRKNYLPSWDLDSFEKISCPRLIP